MHILDPAVYVHMSETGCLSGYVFVLVCMRKGSTKSQYLSEIFLQNHDLPDLSTVMEPDIVSSGFSPLKQEH